MWNPLAFGLLGFASGSDVNALVFFVFLKSVLISFTIVAEGGWMDR